MERQVILSLIVAEPSRARHRFLLNNYRRGFNLRLETTFAQQQISLHSFKTTITPWYYDDTMIEIKLPFNFHGFSAKKRPLSLSTCIHNIQYTCIHNTEAHTDNLLVYIRAGCLSGECQEKEMFQIDSWYLKKLRKAEEGKIGQQSIIRVWEVRAHNEKTPAAQADSQPRRRWRNH